MRSSPPNGNASSTVAARTGYAKDFSLAVAGSAFFGVSHLLGRIELAMVFGIMFALHHCSAFRAGIIVVPIIPCHFIAPSFFQIFVWVYWDWIAVLR